MPKGKGGKKVRFTPESIVMAVAMEGELEMLKQCVKEVRLSLSYHALFHCTMIRQTSGFSRD